MSLDGSSCTKMYRVGGQGLTCLRILLEFVLNARLMNLAILDTVVEKFMSSLR